ncbi:MAG TPA: cupin domain-containing protein, partial [Sneathiellales bacterium]|nr:cupin domain-containing protein [Sneathiellales bacterium]
ASSGVHPHGSLEIFFVIEGNLIHRLNGETHILKPGMVGIARIGDTIDHGVDGDVPVKALVIWVSGGEVDRLVEGGFTSTPLD